MTGNFWTARSLRAGFALLLSLSMVGPVFAQDNSSSGGDVNGALGGALSGGVQSQLGQRLGGSDQGSPNGPAVQNYQPVIMRPRPPSPPSRLENLFSQRAGYPLRQFGYDSLGVPYSISINQAGGVQSDYVVGSGDEIMVVLRGQENSTFRQKVNRNGQIVLPRLAPITALGRKLGDIQEDIRARVARAYIATSAYVSIGEVHQLTVLVTGEVNSPGTRIVSALASPLDAILLSGGIKKTGSLRSVQVSGPSGTRIIDLYSVLAGTGGALGTLHDGDRVLVPPLHETVAVAGGVQRPGIYELPSGAHSMSATALVRLAGGEEIAGAYSLSKTVLQADGSSRTVTIPATAGVQAGEVLFVQPGRSGTSGQVAILGAVARETTFPLSPTSQIGDFIQSSQDLLPNAYTLLSAVVRRDPVSNALVIVPFSLVSSIGRKTSPPLQTNDKIFVFTNDEVRALAARVNLNANSQHDATGFNARPDAGGPADQYSLNGAALGNAGMQRRQQAYGPGREPAVPEPANNGSAPSDYSEYSGQRQRQGSQQANDAYGMAGYGAENDANYDGANAINGTLKNQVGSSGTAGNAAFGQGQPGQYPFGQNQAGQNQPLQQQNSFPAAETLDEVNRIDRQQMVAPATGAKERRRNDETINRLAMRMGVPVPALVRAAQDNLVWVFDEVLNPGPYLVGRNTALTDLLAVAGGLTQQTDLSGIEITSTQFNQAAGTSQSTRTLYDARRTPLSTILVNPQDVIRLRGVPSVRDKGTVTVAGQVNYPGVFDINRSERLSSVLERAGGMTDVAYPYGAIFTRRSAAIEERIGNDRAAREIESQLASLPSTSGSSGQITGDSISYLTSLAQRIRTAPALGRITVTVDPAVLVSHPELDIVLQPGDAIFIPKRPSSVSVTGEVLNPGSFQYRADLTPGDYLDQAGGTTQTAEESRTFIIRPDGNAAPLRHNWLSFDDPKVAPGSTVVVPRDLRPFDWMQFMRDITQVTSQIAVTAASLSVINR